MQRAGGQFGTGQAVLGQQQGMPRQQVQFSTGQHMHFAQVTFQLFPVKYRLLSIVEHMNGPLRY